MHILVMFGNGARRRTVVYVLFRGFASFKFSSCSIFQLANTGWIVVFTFRLRSLSCSFTISAENWSLRGKTTQTVSSVSFAGDKGCCWSQTFESTKLLTVVFGAL